MRNAIHLILAFVIALTCWPTDGFAQSNLWRQQQMMQQQRMQQENMRRQQEMQRQQRETQRRQQEAQRRQMEEQRRRQQAAMQQRQREMQVRQQQIQVQRQKMAEQRQLQQQQRQQETQRQQAQRQQVTQKQTQQTARVAKDRALKLQRDRRLQELKNRTRFQQQEQQRHKAAQQTSTIALLSRTANRASVVSSQNFAQRRQEAAQRFAKLRASRPAAASAGGAGSGGNGNDKALIVANKQFQQQKLQEFRNRQALKGAKETKQDVATKTTGKEITPFVVGKAPAQLKFKPTTGVKIDTKKNATTTVLGNYDKDMRHIIKELNYPKTLDFRSKVGGYNILNTPNALYKSPKQFWEKYNRPFLDKAIKRGDRIILASKPTDVNNLRRTNLNTGQVEKTGFARELEYLRSKGYKYDPKTSSMVPK